jgi:hypothetical protein
VGSGFPKRSCSNKRIERDDFRETYRALAVRHQPVYNPARRYLLK